MKRNFPYLESHFLLGEEELWPFKSDSLDLVVSNLNLHNNNDMSVAFSRILESLRPDGIMAGNTYGRYTLEELKNCLYLAENERSGGFATHAFQ